MAINAPRGTNDFYGDYMEALLRLEEEMRGLCRDFDYHEIRTPMFERLELFQRGVGETTDIVQKEMYTFFDRSADKKEFALKPEGTAGVVRAYLERKLYTFSPTKLYYITPAFRYEKPQAGRFRQFHQFGVELFGSADAAADAEIIALGNDMLRRLGIQNVTLHINSLGNRVSRKAYNELLMDFLHKNEEQLCPTCRERMVKNPLRVLDCKIESCKAVMKDAPLMLNHLDDGDKAHFDELLSLLDEMGIEYVIDPWIVRGLDYYTRTVFEFISEEIGAQGTVCGGGRYDNLIEEMGGEPTPAVGFGAGIERLLLTIANNNEHYAKTRNADIYIGYMGDNAKKKAVSLTNQLRQEGICAVTDLMGKSVKAQMKYADKIACQYSFVIGDNELDTQEVVVKNMQTGEKESMIMEQVANYIKSKKVIE